MKSKSLPHFPGFEEWQYAQSLRIEDENGKYWVFRLSIRRRGYKKPVLSAGWLRFVKTNNLQIGDQVHFLKEQDTTTGRFKYKIKLAKQVKLFGAVIGFVPLTPR
ncbi:hypothetical protein EZV62_017956 [Acer yangbiense]|uniref:TF-B3 domain-containing protein n=1 Tax=Acer yangbiense TaxID=1000413 RepID=A0A5C7HHY7_9ROSI|nr:hypothetical protein EZV62_017956 [Acer yangbiense]